MELGSNVWIEVSKKSLTRFLTLRGLKVVELLYLGRVHCVPIWGPLLGVVRPGPGDDHRAYELVYIKGGINNMNATLMFAHFDEFSAFPSIRGMEYNWVCPTPETLLTEGWRLLDKALKLSQIVSSLRARRKKVDGHPTITDILGKGKFEFRIFLDSTLKFRWNILYMNFCFHLASIPGIAIALCISLVVLDKINDIDYSL